jgi:hypothetical protein
VREKITTSAVELNATGGLAADSAAQTQPNASVSNAIPERKCECDTVNKKEAIHVGSPLESEDERRRLELTGDA